jgi:hypothetical protein
MEISGAGKGFGRSLWGENKPNKWRLIVDPSAQSEQEMRKKLASLFYMSVDVVPDLLQEGRGTLMAKRTYRGLS